MARDYRGSSNHYRHTTPTVDETLDELSQICLDVVVKSKWPHICSQFLTCDGICTICFVWKHNA